MEKPKKVKVGRVLDRNVFFNKANNQLFFNIPRKKLKKFLIDKTPPKKIKIKIQELEW